MRGLFDVDIDLDDKYDVICEPADDIIGHDPYDIVINPVALAPTRLQRARYSFTHDVSRERIRKTLQNLEHMKW